jgi:hypothetical protein
MRLRLGPSGRTGGRRVANEVSSRDRRWSRVPASDWSRTRRRGGHPGRGRLPWRSPEHRRAALQPGRAGPDPRDRHSRQPRPPAGGHPLRRPSRRAPQGARGTPARDRGSARSRASPASGGRSEETSAGDKGPPGGRCGGGRRASGCRGRFRAHPFDRARLPGEPRAECDRRDRRRGGRDRVAGEARRRPERDHGRRGLPLGGERGGRYGLAF